MIQQVEITLSPKSRGFHLVTSEVMRQLPKLPKTGIVNMTLEQFHRFWDAVAREYTGQDDHAAFDALAGRFAVLDIVLRTVFQKPSFAEKLFFASYVRKLMKQYYSL